MSEKATKYKMFISKWTLSESEKKMLTDVDVKKGHLIIVDGGEISYYMYICPGVV